MPGVRVKGKSSSSSRTRKPTRVAGAKEGKAVSSNGHPQPHAHVALPTWIVPVMVNLAAMFVAVGTTYGLMQGELSGAKLQINSLGATLAAQIQRIDSMMKEQERTTRLEERLTNVVTMLTEIRSDLRDGKYSARPDAVPPR